MKWNVLETALAKLTPPPPTELVSLTEPAIHASDRANKFLQRTAEAREWFPSFFSSEKEFWAKHPSPATYAPFPTNVATGDFVSTPSRFDNPSLSPDQSAKWLLSALLAVIPIDAELQIKPTLIDKVIGLWKDEADALLPQGCKAGRDVDGIVLTLYTSEGAAPAKSRIQYNPATDASVGECAIVRMDADDSPGGRGWDLALIDTIPDKDAGTNEFKV